MTNRSLYIKQLRTGFCDYPITALFGPRQCGKTTLARQLAAEHPGETTFFDLEDPTDESRLREPKLALESLRGLVIIDEVQRKPELFPLLRVLADRPTQTCRFFILGSVAPELRLQAAESLAGRIRYVELAGFDATEVGFAFEQVDRLWLRGGFPKSFLAAGDEASFDWRLQFTRTFWERDLPALGLKIPGERLRRFWTMLAHYHGQAWNATGIAASLGVSFHTTSNYLDFLTGALLVRQLPAWYEDLGKRVRRAPKVYLRDSGILHSLLQLRDWRHLEAHPKLGASWEGFVIEEILRYLSGAQFEAYSWGLHSGAEIDLFLLHEGKRWGFEVKYSDAPKMTKSLRAAMDALRLDECFIVTANRSAKPMEYEIAKGVTVCDLETVAKRLRE
jgi:uncharacterized protein